MDMKTLAKPSTVQTPTSEVDAIETLPETESHLHNSTGNPLECWCCPDVAIVYEEDGSPWYITVDHKWIQ